MTKQEYYDLLVKTSRAGGFPSAERNGSDVDCLYRGPDGRKCAVGLLIPDDLYVTQMNSDREGCVASDLPTDLLAAVTPLGMTATDLNRVQRCHDKVARATLPAGGPWDHVGFVRLLNTLDCFSDVLREEG